MNHPSGLHGQRGATLLISLVLLLMLTVLALVASRGATLQQRMASNLQQQNLAFQAAENGIQAAILQMTGSDEYGRPQLDEPRYLFSDLSVPASDLPPLLSVDCKGSSKEHYFCVKVEREADCSGNGTAPPVEGSSVVDGNPVSVGTAVCYTIYSIGHHQTSTVVHEQGYMF